MDHKRIHLEFKYYLDVEHSKTIKMQDLTLGHLLTVDLKVWQLVKIFHHSLFIMISKSATKITLFPIMNFKQFYKTIKILLFIVVQYWILILMKMSTKTNYYKI